MSQSPSPIGVMTADGTYMSLPGVDSICIPHLSLSDVYYVLKLTMNPVSMI